MRNDEWRDWSEKDLKTHLVEMRKHLWRESHISWIGRWLGTGSGIRMLDA